VRYFFIKDRVDNGEIVIEHCPTAEMIADYFTKPLQGALFIKFRNFIMNDDLFVEDDTKDHRSVLKQEAYSHTNENKNEVNRQKNENSDVHVKPTYKDW